MTFIQMTGFDDDWEELGLSDDDLQALEVIIMVSPTTHPVVKGTGGLRKLRFSNDARHKGKRGGVRVCYVYYEEFNKILLIQAYGKDEKDDLDPAEARAFKKLIQQVREDLGNL